MHAASQLPSLRQCQCHGRGNCRGNGNGQQCLADANANRPAGMNAEVSAMETSQLRAFYNYEQYDVKPVVVAAHMCPTGSGAACSLSVYVVRTARRYI